jgi:hypothetical protein
METSELSQSVLYTWLQETNDQEWNARKIQILAARNGNFAHLFVLYQVLIASPSNILAIVQYKNDHYLGQVRGQQATMRRYGESGNHQFLPHFLPFLPLRRLSL